MPKKRNKMKINWGTGIVLAFAAFISFILYFVVLASTDRKADHDLVTEHYYEKELGFQEEIDAAQIADLPENRILISREKEGIRFHFPATVSAEPVSGTLEAYRPSDKGMDFDLPVVLVNGNMVIPDSLLARGRWDITIRWESNGIRYMRKEAVTLQEKNAIGGSSKALKR